MQDLKNNLEEPSSEGNSSLDFFFEYTDLEELPERFFNLLPGYCDRLLTLSEKLEELTPPSEIDLEEDLLNSEVEAACVRGLSLVYLSTPGLYWIDNSPLSSLPKYDQCEAILPEEFFFI